MDAAFCWKETAATSDFSPVTRRAIPSTRLKLLFRSSSSLGTVGACSRIRLIHEITKVSSLSNLMVEPMPASLEVPAKAEATEQIII
jgi:hypothetical protein